MEEKALADTFLRDKTATAYPAFAEKTQSPTKSMNQTWYHATTLDCWSEIQREGVLWGKRKAPSRCTYLAAKVENAIHYGEVILEVHFNPEEHKPNNFHPDCWQCRVYCPIELKLIRLINL